MLSKSFFESVYRLNECGNFVGRCGSSHSSSNDNSSNLNSNDHSIGRGRSYRVGDWVTIVTSDGEFVDGELVGKAD